MAHDFDGRHQNRQRNTNEQRHAGIRRSQEMSGVVSQSFFADSLRIVIDESADGAAQRNRRHGGRRLKTRNQPDQIAEQDKKSQGHQEGREALASVSNNLVALTLDEPVGSL